MKKSTRHSKITGDFAEVFVLYWLSKDGYECARLDHTGIDLIAAKNGKRLGISVKSRSRYDRTEKMSVNIPTDGYEKAENACREFGCEPYYAIVVDGANVVRCFLLTLDDLKAHVTGSGATQFWQMGDRAIAQYKSESTIRWFEMHWSESPASLS